MLQRLALDLLIHIVFQFLAQYQPARGPLQVADFGFIQGHGFFLQLKSIHAAGIQGAHHAARTGARHHGGREAVGLQHLDDADVGKALGGATAQSNADLEGRCRMGCGG